MQRLLQKSVKPPFCCTVTILQAYFPATAQKVLGKKFPEKKEIKSYEFETLISRPFFWLRMILYKNSRKKSSYSRKFMRTKDVYNHAKKEQLILKAPMAIFKVQMHKKVFFIKTY